MLSIFHIVKFLSLVVLLLSCSHMRRGQHVYWMPGQSLENVAKAQGASVADIKRMNPDARAGTWVLIPNQVGFLSLLDDTSVVEDYSYLGKGEYAWPVPTITKVSSSFGSRWGRNHDGLDIAGPVGTPIVAVADGVVRYSDNKVSGYGNMIIIEHANGVFSVYAHNSKNLVSFNSKVVRGQRIALMGNTGRSTGPHLHFEIRIKNKARDPAGFLSKPRMAQSY